MGLTEELGLSSVCVQLEVYVGCPPPAVFWERLCQGYQAPATCPTLSKWEVTGAGEGAGSLSFWQVSGRLAFSPAAVLC